LVVVVVVVVVVVFVFCGLLFSLFFRLFVSRGIGDVMSSSIRGNRQSDYFLGIGGTLITFLGLKVPTCKQTAHWFVFFSRQANHILLIKFLCLSCDKLAITSISWEKTLLNFASFGFASESLTDFLKFS
jgi:hypothetical protein